MVKSDVGQGRPSCLGRVGGIVVVTMVGNEVLGGSEKDRRQSDDVLDEVVELAMGILREH